VLDILVQPRRDVKAAKRFFKRLLRGLQYAHSFIYGHFHPRRHRMSACTYREARAGAFTVWRQETCVKSR
jgi:transposase-like protein